MKNNIFEYATGELSQDAFICWCANWFNDDSKPKLRDMSVELMKLFAGVDEIHSVSVYSRQFMKIDVLIIVNGFIAVIIEDKVYTSEHDNQIQRYVKAIRDLAELAEEGEDFYGINELPRTVFFKTGFMYDTDKCVKSDVVVSGEDFLQFLSKYSGESEILDSYIEKLESRLKWYDDFGKYEGTSEHFTKWNIVNHQIAQYRLMRDIFPESLWVDKSSKLYKVRHGANRDGRPWTNMRIKEKCYTDSEDTLAVFWRIDSDKKGPYLSLRLYDEFDKNDAAKKDRHRELYESMLGVVKGIIEEKSSYQWNDVYPGYCGNYWESSIVHIKIEDKLMNWGEEKEGLIEEVRRITREFQEEMEKII